jgi:trans-aconitate methyltransferase
MSVFNYLLEQTFVYSLWQAPFASAKLAPLLAHNSLDRARRVLDVGCGPGTNTHLFSHADYLGIDINPGYIAHARKKHNRQFVVADVSSYNQPVETGFDFILVNSFLHHIDAQTTSSILERLQSWLAPGGHIHLLELVLPTEQSLQHFMARRDRGEYPRPLTEWRQLFEQHLDLVVFEPYDLGTLGIPFWNMIYSKGRAKR